jgi:hypothetical protein
MVVGFMTTYAISAITTNVLSSNPAQARFNSCSWRGIHHYMIKFVSDLRQVIGFLWVLQFSPPIKLTATNLTEVFLKVALNTITLSLNTTLCDKVCQ